MLDAAAFSNYRLPEAFSGYPRSRGRFPVPYPTACSPQAWATGAPLLLLRAMLGLEARDGQVTLDPALPDAIGRVTITRHARLRHALGRGGGRPPGHRSILARGLTHEAHRLGDHRHNGRVTDPRAPRADPPAFMTADELAMRTGTPRERIIELTERGVIQVEAPDHYAPGDVHRIRLVGAFESEGITIDALVAAAEQGRISFAYYDELHPPPGPIAPHTYGEFKASLGRLGERLPSLYVAFGLAEPNPTARLEAAEEAFLTRLLENMDRTRMPEAANRIVRLFGEGNRRAAEGALGVYEDVLAQLGEAIALTGIPPREEYERVLQPWAQMARLAPELAAYLATKHLSRTIDAFSSETTERVLEETGFVAERQVVYPGVAFVDLTGFTRLSEERGDQAAAGVSLELGELARTTAEAHGGRVVKLLGDGVLLRLPTARTAVEATLELLGALPSAGLPSGHAGIHTGPLIEREGDVFGRSVNLAARVSDVAPAGETYVTEAVAEALKGSPIAVDPVAPADLQGIGPVALFRVVGAS